MSDFVLRDRNGREAVAKTSIDWHTEQVRKGAALLPPHGTGEGPAILARFDLPSPPSTNNLFRNVPGKGRVYSDTYKNWLSHAGWKLQLAWRGAPALRGSLALTLRLAPGIDIDNIKAVPDLLKKIGVIVDDRYIVELHVYREDGRGTCGVEIKAA